MSSIRTQVKSWQRRVQRIDKELAMQIEDAGVEFVMVQSPIDEHEGYKSNRKPVCCTEKLY